MAAWDRYPTYNVYVQMMQHFAEKYPNITLLDTIGYTQLGHLILVLKITDNPTIDEDEPEVFYTGQMHGDEIVDYVMFLRLIDYMLSHYGTDTEVDSLINNIELWINPLSNPDGAYIGGDDDISGAQRYLANGIDPNRNYPGPTAGTGGNHPDGKPWAKETINMMRFAQNHDFVMSANTHSGAEVANYPWDSWRTSSRKTADDDWWRFVSKEYADHAQEDSPGDYFTDVTNRGYIEGGDWYVVYGGRQDYMNYYQHCREMTWELSSEKLLASDSLPSHWTYNKNAFLDYMRESLYGIRGIVTDACTGKPIKAKIEILNHDTMNSFVYTAMPVGDYHRPIYEGTYSMKISADGYQSKIINNISVANHSTVYENVQLEPEVPKVDFNIVATPSCNGKIQFFDNTAMSDTTASYHWDFGDGMTDTLKNTIHQYATMKDSVYKVKLTVNNACGGESYIIKPVSIRLWKSIDVDDQGHCGSGQVLLTGNDILGCLYWYDESDSLVAIGDTFLTPVLNDSKTYFVQSIVSDTILTVGDTSVSTNGGFLSERQMHYLEFDCYRPTTLISVKVNAETTGDREILLRNAEGFIYNDTVVTIPQGISEIALNFKLPKEKNLQLVAPVYAGLYETESDLHYPYTIDSLISIKRGDKTTSKYLYFYDWKVMRPQCVSRLDTVIAHIDTAKPKAQFEVSISGDTIRCKNRSQNAYKYYWDFGDGDTSCYVNPIHEYADTGSYSVMLIAKNECFSDTVLQQVFVTEINSISVESERLSVYPNPFTERMLTVQSSCGFDGKLVLYNMLGSIAYIEHRHRFIEGSNKIYLPELQDGLYLLEITNMSNRNYKRKVFLIQRK